MAKSIALDTAFNTYHLAKQIGEGGNGIVWEASDIKGAKFAIKILNAERANSDKRKRFQREITFCQRADHPNIIKVLDHGITLQPKGPSPFYVMPLFTKTLCELFAESLPSERRLAYFDQILSGVEAAHLQNVYHRDLKPKNILYDATTDSVAVADFGIAHFVNEELYTSLETPQGARMFNVDYAAPEQKRKDGVTDARTDIFALGLMLNEAFTGHVPLGVNPRQVGGSFPAFAWVDEVANEMMQTDPANRPGSIDIIKRTLKARHQEYVERQRLSEIQNKVIPVGQEDDPLAITPPKIVGFDVTGGQITLILSRSVNPGWIHAFRRLGNFTSVRGKGPDKFNFIGDRAMIAAPGSDDSEVQQIIDYFHSWLPQVTETYRRDRQILRQAEADDEQKRIRQEQMEIERQLRIRKNVRLPQ